MAITLGLSDRRCADRRAVPRGGPDRRRNQRRAAFRTLLFAGAAIVLPHQLNPATLRVPLRTAMRLVSRVSVQVTIDAFVGIPPWRAYDELIREASARYRLDPVLVRAVMQAESA